MKRKGHPSFAKQAAARPAASGGFLSVTALPIDIVVGGSCLRRLNNQVRN